MASGPGAYSVRSRILDDAAERFHHQRACSRRGQELAERADFWGQSAQSKSNSYAVVGCMQSNKSRTWDQQWDEPRESRRLGQHLDNGQQEWTDRCVWCSSCSFAIGVAVPQPSMPSYSTCSYSESEFVSCHPAWLPVAWMDTASAGDTTPQRAP